MAHRESVEEFLARGGQIQQCGSTMQQAKSLKRMRAEDESRLAQPQQEDHRGEEAYFEDFGAARCAGMSISDALDYANGL